ncbi:aspartyl/glutamyl-tRNA amidotransferase subunit A [Spiroplasma chinense]|uniref:Aspartyl/glutamyl-tRNA amidotransferase subunit A n=1 Tax=Spiroplasma chinense TaxID=216932 RepID=A0A5B9Y5Q6_9MOLU|nr:amidase family protein [Spiroplasma chinense]QEH61362.1 aspartyl/glutamyl-tRNA amidotransferase subunit A [Spiroplasma chinense]
MEFTNLSIVELHNKLKNKELTIKELAKSVYKNLQENLDSNFLVTLIDEEQIENLDQEFDETNLLSGIPYVTKDNISTKGIKTTAGTKILSNYFPATDATITEKLKESKTVLLGKSTLDELGMGGTGLFGFNGEVRNPFDNERIVGGSSSGSAYAVAKGLVPFATGTDTGDSIRKPASFNGIVGFKPTYGSISRFGVIPYAPSLDHVGFFTRNVEDMAIVCDATFGYDKKDFTSIENKHEFYKNLNENKKFKFGFLEVVEKHMTGKIHDDYVKIAEKIKQDGNEVINLEFRKDLLDALPAVYMMISFAEAVSTHANLDGINFGNRVEGVDYIDTMRKSRAKNFGATVKKRMVIGSYQLKQENQERLLAKSKKVRRLIIEELNKMFEQVDVLIMPASLKIAPLVKEIYGVEIEDRDDNEAIFLEDLLVLANMNGMPSITLPFVKHNNLPIGINLNAKPKEDLKLLQASKYLEDLISKVIKESGDFNE